MHASANRALLYVPRQSWNVFIQKIISADVSAIRLPYLVSICLLPYKGGHLDVIMWAMQHGSEWDSNTCLEAALGGHLDVLKWCRAHGAPWHVDTCSAAAGGGHLAVLQWCRHNGAPAW